MFEGTQKGDRKTINKDLLSYSLGNKKTGREIFIHHSFKFSSKFNSTNPRKESLFLVSFTHQIHQYS